MPPTTSIYKDDDFSSDSSDAESDDDEYTLGCNVDDRNSIEASYKAKSSKSKKKSVSDKTAEKSRPRKKPRPRKIFFTCRRSLCYIFL